MKKSILLILTVLLMFSTPVDASEVNAPSVSARAFVLYCVNNSQVVLSKNAHEKLEMASTTKIMTSLLALEEAEKDDSVVTFRKEMEAEGSSMYLKAGDKVRLSDLAAGMMTVSGNDAANAVALTLSDSIEGFSVLMNRRAKEIGMKNTCFANPSGLPDENHYSTAFDMALLMSEAITNDAFMELTGKKSVEVEFVYPPHKVTYSNHNKLLSLYPDCIGGKTGYTKSAGRCLVTASSRRGVTLVCVTLDASDDWNDHKALYNYGFSKYSAVTNAQSENIFVTVMGGKSESVMISSEKSLPFAISEEDAQRIISTVYVTPCVFAPVNEGDKLGKVIYTLDDETVYEVSLKACSSVERAELKAYERIIKRLFG